MNRDAVDIRQETILELRGEGVLRLIPGVQFRVHVL